jgi:hypothetical protein
MSEGASSNSSSNFAARPRTAADEAGCTAAARAENLDGFGRSQP